MLTRSKTFTIRENLKNYKTIFSERRTESFFRENKKKLRQKQIAQSRSLSAEIDWISASMTRNFALNDPILDWLELYGEKNGYLPDYEFSNNYSEVFDFNNYIMKKGVEFENAVISYIKQKFPNHYFRTISYGHADSTSPEKYQDTLTAMADQVPFIYQAVLRDEQNKLCGSVDLLVRSDYLEDIIENPPKISEYHKKFHYVVVDIKYATLHFSKDMQYLLNSGSMPAYKAQIAIYNNMLGIAQDFKPQYAYLLGRCWKTRNGAGSDSALDRLGVVDFENLDAVSEETATKAVAWLRKLRKFGHKWSPHDPANYGRPSVPELYPNMRFTEDAPWHNAKKQIADEIDEITLLWNCGVKERNLAHSHGIYHWQDCTPETLGFKEDGVKQTVLDHILDQNIAEFVVPPAFISNDDKEWQTETKHDFYVDFETVSNVNDDFTTFPLKGGCEMIWMIGCGYKNNGTWEFRNFTAKHLVVSEEYRILSEWLNYMAAFTKMPRVFHWSSAEEVLMKHSSEKHNFDIGHIQWIDMCKIFVKEPIVVPGMLSFKLKEVAKAFYKLKYIKTNWDNSYIDGIGSMAAAWICDVLAVKSNLTLNDIETIDKIKHYNYVDTRVIFEIVRYLRQQSNYK